MDGGKPRVKKADTALPPRVTTLKINSRPRVALSHEVTAG
jgi:hypothetical protein